MRGKVPINEAPCRITNVYRTEKYIVYQSVCVCYGESGNILISDDIYRLRTPERDEAYLRIYGKESRSNRRKRMKVAKLYSYIRGLKPSLIIKAITDKEKIVPGVSEFCKEVATVWKTELQTQCLHNVGMHIKTE